jgi:phospholipid/cholesterol/gamma-HCH transport system substrate-binding protein
MRDNKINYVIVGVFVLAMLTAILSSILVLTGRAGSVDTYYMLFNNVAGVNRGTKVQFEGYPIGQVTGIEPVREGKELRFKVWATVQHDWPMPDDSLAQIAASGLLSAVVVDIRAGKSSTMLQPGARVPSGEGGNLFSVMSSVANEVTDLSQNTLKPLLNNLNSQVTMLGGILHDNAPQLMANLLAVSGDLKDKTPQITTNVQDFTVNLNKVLSQDNLKAIDASLANVQHTTESFAQLAGDLRSTEKRLDTVMDQLGQVVASSKGDVQGSLAELRRTLSDVSRSVTVISSNLEGASRNLNEFSREVRRDPTQLLRRGPVKDEQPGRQRP